MKKLFLLFVSVSISYIGYSQTNTFPTTGNVGIGTITPSALLEVKGTNSTLLDGTIISFSRSNGPSYVCTKNVGGYLTFITNGRSTGDANGNLVLKSDLNSYFNGNVGIGTITPRNYLDVAGKVSIGTASPTTGSGLELYHYVSTNTSYVNSYN